MRKYFVLAELAILLWGIIALALCQIAIPLWQIAIPVRPIDSPEEHPHSPEEYPHSPAWAARRGFPLARVALATRVSESRCPPFFPCTPLQAPPPCPSPPARLLSPPFSAFPFSSFRPSPAFSAFSWPRIGLGWSLSW
jgi:hypothetical protein